MKYLLIVLSLMVCSSIAFAQDNPMKDDCGDWRWDVKTLTDSRFTIVDFGDTVRSTVAEQASLNPDKDLNAFHDISTERFPSEKSLFLIHAKLAGYKEEYDNSKQTGDHDFHIILSDLEKDSTMVVEIPSIDDCDTPASSTHHQQFESARQNFLSILKSNHLPAPKKGKIQMVPDSKTVFLDVVGIGFWDLPGHFDKKTKTMKGHGTGSALNGREIHPVLQISEASNN